MFTTNIYFYVMKENHKTEVQKHDHELRDADSVGDT